MFKYRGTCFLRIIKSPMICVSVRNVRFLDLRNYYFVNFN